VIATVGTWAVNPHLYKLPYDVTRDFAPIIQVSTSPGVLVVQPSVPVKSVKELIALAKAKPGKLDYGSSGVGGFGHISGALFSLMTRTEMVHIPYKSSAPSLIDLIAGQIQVLFNNAISTVPFIKSRQVRALAVTSIKRMPALAELPTIDEAGVKGYDNSSWSAVAAARRHAEGNHRQAQQRAVCNSEIARDPGKKFSGRRRHHRGTPGNSAII